MKDVKKNLTMIFCVGPLLVLGDLAKMEVVVVDDDTGLPMTNVTVKGTFPINNGWSAFKGAARPNTDVQNTNAKGWCRLSGETNKKVAWCEVENPPSGYYGGCGCAFRYAKSMWGVLQPDNQIGTVRVARVHHAIPLYVKYVGDRGTDCCDVDLFSKSGGTLRMDLFKGDWLPPAGTGEVADIEFVRMQREHLGEERSEITGDMIPCWREGMKIRFLGEGNGWVEVKPTECPVAIRKSPDSGFVQEYPDALIDKRSRGASLSKVGEKYICFRIRTSIDAAGNVVAGYYGKIYGDIFFKHKIGWDPVVAMPEMLYYLNPNPLDRNLEWDGEKNLFGGKRIHAPR